MITREAISAALDDGPVDALLTVRPHKELTEHLYRRLNGFTAADDVDGYMFACDLTDEHIGRRIRIKVGTIFLHREATGHQHWDEFVIGSFVPRSRYRSSLDDRLVTIAPEGEEYSRSYAKTARVVLL